jgi:putative ABC transport system permease protein
MSWRRLTGLWNRYREDAALVEELEFHRSQIQADLEAQGLSPADARDASRRRMGNVTLAREDAREVWIARWLDQLRLDLRCSVRSLLHQPLIAVAAVLATALGVATTTTVFSVADAELWKPLPFAQPEQLVAVASRGPGERASNDGISGADLLDWRQGLQAFSEITFSGRTSRQVLQRRTAESVVVSAVTANYFTTLGRTSVVGRVFANDDTTGERRVVLTDRAWQRLFSSDPAIIGTAVLLDETPASIVGVVRADDSLDPDPDFFLAFDERSPAFLDRANSLGYSVIARLRSGVTAAQAQAEVQSFARQHAIDHATGRADHRIVVEDLAEYYSGNNWRPLYFFVGASLLVLLLSTVNVATLLLSRAIQRGPEFSLRRALGGGSTVLARQLFVEGSLLAVMGSVLGVVFSAWAIGALSALIPDDLLRRGVHITMDIRVAAFSMAAAGLATVVFGLAPLPMARRAGASDALRSGARAGRGPREGKARGILLGVQVALTLVLLVGAALFLKSFVALTQVPLGFEPANLSALRVTLSGPRYATDEALLAFSRRLIETAERFPGARLATIATTAPLGSGPMVFLAKNGQPRPADGGGERAILRSVGADFFQTLGINVTRGRGFSQDDGAGSARVAVINAVLAKRLFTAGEDPVGQLIDLLPARARWTNRPGALTIVGIASNIKEIGINEIEFGDIYVPFDQMPSPSLELIVRTGVAPDLQAQRALAADIDPLMPITSAVAFDQRVDDAFAADTFNLAVVSGFAVVAMLLAAIGIHAAASYHVRARTRDFGVRLALGAAPRALIWAAVWRTVRPALIGGAAGLGFVLVLARVIGDALYLVPGSHNGLLFGVTTTDPASLLAAFIGLVTVAVVAATLPARQLTRLDPMRTLSAD